MIEIVRLSGSLKRVCPLIALIDEGAEQFKAKKYLYRMCDLSQFMKVLKQRFTQWFNKRHGRRGTLWEDYFKSVLVEDGYTARVMSAYIDLNPLRAGIVNDPARYRWSSYGAAVAGDRLARGGGIGGSSQAREPVAGRRRDRPRRGGGLGRGGGRCRGAENGDRGGRSQEESRCLCHVFSLVCGFCRVLHLEGLSRHGGNRGGPVLRNDFNGRPKVLRACKSHGPGGLSC